MPVIKQPTSESGSIKSVKKPVKVIYFTDPICSSCWGIEPQLRKMKLEYGHLLDIEYKMGGLLPDWSYNSGGISKPSDVAHHWDEVSGYYDMPIDGDVWLEDPLHSSYPPSIAFKAAQMQSKDKAIFFLREIREMVFLQKKNITRWEHLEAAAATAGLDVHQFRKDYEGQAIVLFEEDLALARSMRVRGFPTMFFSDSTGKVEMVYGSKPYAAFQSAIQSVFADADSNKFRKDWSTLFDLYPSWTAREFSEVSGMSRQESESLLNNLTEQNLLQKMTTKNGSLWKRSSR